MIRRSSRLALCLIALLLTVSLYIRGRVTAGKGEGAAPFLSKSAGLKVRLAGDFPRPGLYLFPDGTSVAVAIKMTAPGRDVGLASGTKVETPLHSGDVVTLHREEGKPPVLSLGKMGVKERMLLKIPLDPDLLTSDEWCELPGIGPVLAERIVADRHKNGGFGSLRGVLRVPGIGPGKLETLRKHF